MHDRVLHAPPRCVEVRDHPTFFIFLDGACTTKSPDTPWSGTSVGGVLCDRMGRCLHYFGEVLDESITGLWSKGDRTQLIYEAEVFLTPSPCICGRSCFREFAHSFLSIMRLPNFHGSVGRPIVGWCLQS